MRDAELPTVTEEPKANRIWSFLNSAFGLWLLSTIAIGGGAWVFQQLRDIHDSDIAEQDRVERLNFEIAGRISEYLAWFYNNMAHDLDNKHGVRDFNQDTTVTGIAESLEMLGDVPQLTTPSPIHELLPEFKSRNLLSIYGELNLLNEKAIRRAHLARGGEIYICDLRDVRSQNHGDPIEKIRAENYSCAMDIFVDPQSLPLEAHHDYRQFKVLFERIFLSPDIQSFNFPYTDCFDC